MGGTSLQQPKPETSHMYVNAGKLRGDVRRCGMSGTGADWGVEAFSRLMVCCCFFEPCVMGVREEGWTVPCAPATQR